MKNKLLKSRTKVKEYFNKITCKQNKSYAQELRQEDVTQKKINSPKMISNEVISMVLELKGEGENTINFIENRINKNSGVTNFEEMITKLKNFIEENSKDEKIPSSKEIMNHLGIKSEKLRLKLLKKLHEQGVLIKGNTNTYKYNLDRKKIV